ncbi:ATP-dependent endonuclease [Leptospira santarosai]|uniref:ATP-dependent nuclease n=1 Tax=Leptospira santarosai TaxID=28183 RepID=UPI0007782ADC|nr:ATP-dependent endonuclease [Leptospira santarosai]KXZ29005.1 ATP-dependent endonuclease [Leptospira santarosai]
MYITEIEVKNFRLLKNVRISLQETSTIIVGRNNSGKTSLTEIFRRFFSDKKIHFYLEDFHLSSLALFKEALTVKQSGGSEEDIRKIIPKIELNFTINYEDDKADFGILSDYIIDLDENSTNVNIKISYEIADGKIGLLFEELSFENELDSFIRKMKERIPALFSTKIYTIDPTDPNNRTTIEYSKLKNLINVDFISAQRGLDDITQNEKNILGKALNNIFRTAATESAPPDMKKISQELEEIIQEIQVKVDTDFKEKVDSLIPSLNNFGHPALSDSKLSTETTLNIQSLLDTNTRIRYLKAEGISLPESYNGLGSRNLLYMIFQLFDYFRKNQSNSIQAKSHLIFIEEPEAHLHPQMQEVFIKQLEEVANDFSVKFNKNIKWPVQFIVTTHSTHIANQADFSSIRYFKTSTNKPLQTNIKDFGKEFNSEDAKEDREFIHKYLTLTRCDLFFADKAMLIEGATERIMMPIIVNKIDREENTSLFNQYYSVVEVGGAYAHHFYKFIDFLELRTLFITDLDSTKIGISSKGKKVHIACEVSDGTHSSNVGIKEWFKTKGEILDLKEIRRKEPTEKITGSRRLAFQIPEENSRACGRSFEDAFLLSNRELFDLADFEEDKVESEAFSQAEKIKKTNFAVKYSLELTDWNVPLYIKEGIIWLAEFENKGLTKRKGSKAKIKNEKN